MVAVQAPQRRTGWARCSAVWLLAVPAVWVAYVLAYNPTDRVADPTGPCLWHAVFGIDGQTCGITRMTWYLLHGDVLDAARMHLTALLLVPAGAYAYVWWAAGWIAGRQLPMPRVGTRLLVGYGAFFLLYAVLLRNLPVAPLTWFAVPNLT